jgi:hypothetical protein
LISAVAVPNTNFRLPNTNFRVPNTNFRVPKLKTGVLSLNGGDNKHKPSSKYGIAVSLPLFIVPNIFTADLTSGFYLLSLRVGEDGMVKEAIAFETSLYTYISR